MRIFRAGSGAYAVVRYQTQSATQPRSSRHAAAPSRSLTLYLLTAAPSMSQVRLAKDLTTGEKVWTGKCLPQNFVLTMKVCTAFAKKARVTNTSSAAPSQTAGCFEDSAAQRGVTRFAQTGGASFLWSGGTNYCRIQTTARACRFVESFLVSCAVPLSRRPVRSPQRRRSEGRVSVARDSSCRGKSDREDGGAGRNRDSRTSAGRSSVGSRDSQAELRRHILSAVELTQITREVELLNKLKHECA